MATIKAIKPTTHSAMIIVIIIIFYKKEMKQLSSASINGERFPESDHQNLWEG